MARLRSSDAVHLALALLVREVDEVGVATFDNRLAAGAASEGLRVVPETP